MYGPTETVQLVGWVLVQTSWHPLHLLSAFLHSFCTHNYQCEATTIILLVLSLLIFWVLKVLLSYACEGIEHSRAGELES